MSKTTFTNKYGAITAIAASAVGLGNIWRFPYLAGENGGAVFIFIYIISTILISIPILISKLTLGRETGTDVIGAYSSSNNKMVNSRLFWTTCILNCA